MCPFGGETIRSSIINSLSSAENCVINSLRVAQGGLLGLSVTHIEEPTWARAASSLKIDRAAEEDSHPIPFILTRKPTAGTDQSFDGHTEYERLHKQNKFSQWLKGVKRRRRAHTGQQSKKAVTVQSSELQNGFNIILWSSLSRFRYRIVEMWLLCYSILPHSFADQSLYSTLYFDIQYVYALKIKITHFQHQCSYCLFAL